MNSDKINLIVDAKERIVSVVADYRSTAGEEAYRWVVKYELGLPFKLPNKLYVGILLSIGIGYVVAYYLGFADWNEIIVGGVIVALLSAFGYIQISPKFKKKEWRNDYLRESDFVYLCKNPMLQQRLIAKLKIDKRITCTWLETNASTIIENIDYLLSGEDHLKFIERLKINTIS
ncbi:TPA: hypothetical protein R4250_004401 [Escherichia coli]|uniref:hypothetical protein n=1 Tax=Citrobacter freundii TaxID=546 RepID=UPI000FDADF82|nr:hypothetical protein [Citrobacter freundii]RVS10428.1 hypothetical protein EOL15_02090 [Citrobacter freundii]HED4020355.1 hypothetical protein [Escherichia coli]